LPFRPGKEPGSRYPTACDLADDLTRFPAFKPVTAKPTGALIRTLRVVRRHSTSSALVAVICLVVFGGPMFFGLQQQAARERIGETLERTKEESARAHREAETSRQITRFVIDLFKVYSPAD